ncbi:hypothetical protein BKH42_03700 [Helicobacter sp. 13S00482-2]|uniref:hypothetical protein n=1 Tax=Helicobacter sp. 13S00482-2 TaxID=1476200 RepID=UPI000BA4E907|nr:hypothetical protein [Helicobacter sp. 13S00482-2]PAF53846.1 hypothetical protein BKH42_03700 [Helicobacter sp. 13S00482-2]
MKKVILSVLFITIFYQISNAQEVVKGNKKDLKEKTLEAETKAKDDYLDKTQQDGIKVLKSNDKDQITDENKNLINQNQISSQNVKKMRKGKFYPPNKAEKGKIVFMQRGHTGLFVGPFKSIESNEDTGIAYGAETTYKLGIGYFVTDKFRLEALAGLGLWGIKGSGRATGGVSFPVELVGSWNLSDREYWKKNTELFVSLGYDVGIVDLTELDPSIGMNIKKITLNIGVTFSNKTGIRASFSPYNAVTFAEKYKGSIFYMPPKTVDVISFGLAFTYRP